MNPAGVVAPAVCAGLALLLWPSGPQRRLTSIRRGATRRSAGTGTDARPRWPSIAAGAPVVMLLVLAPELWWLLVPCGIALRLGLRSSPSRARRDRERRLLVVHADLLASCLDAGMPVAAALRSVSDAMRAGAYPVGPSDGDSGLLVQLDAVATLLHLGADPDVAWRRIEGEPDLAPMASAARRSAAGGAGLAQALREHASSLRDDLAGQSKRAAGRAGIVMVAPLAGCFLPAFICLGLAPVVIGLIGTLGVF